MTERCPPRNAVPVASLLIAATLMLPGPAVTTTTTSQDVFQEVWSLVNEHFFDAEFNGVDWPAMRDRYAADARLTAGAAGRTDVIREMLATLKTSHTACYTPDDREYYDLLGIFAGPLSEFVEERFGGAGVRYEGIGVITKLIDGRWHIIDILPGTPAARGELAVGDEIVEAGGQPYAPIESFRGRAGQVISLTIQRTRLPDSRRTVDLPVEWMQPMPLYEKSVSASARVIGTDAARIAYVRIRNYASPVMHEALEGLVTRNGRLAHADALILDLRGGWGGANPGYLDLFDTHVPTLTYQSRDNPPFTIDDRWRKPVVLLVDGGTRSGKEVLTYGFRKHGIGTVVGERTAGAVTGGRPFVLSDGSLLFLAVSDVLVDGERIEGRGVEPDISVARNISYAAGADPQLERAIEVAASDVAKKTGPDTTVD